MEKTAGMSETGQFDVCVCFLSLQSQMVTSSIVTGERDNVFLDPHSSKGFFLGPRGSISEL